MNDTNENQAFNEITGTISEEFTFKYFATTLELKKELRRIIDAYREDKLSTENLEYLVKEYAEKHKDLLYEQKEPFYLKRSIYNYLGQKRLNIIKNIIRVDVEPKIFQKENKTRKSRKPKDKA